MARTNRRFEKFPRNPAIRAAFTSLKRQMLVALLALAAGASTATAAPTPPDEDSTPG